MKCQHKDCRANHGGECVILNERGRKTRKWDTENCAFYLTEEQHQEDERMVRENLEAKGLAYLIEHYWKDGLR